MLIAGESALETTMSVSVSVTNNGEYASGNSAEVVMVYATPKIDGIATSEMSIPRQILLGFTKLLISPGATEVAQVKVVARRLQLVGSDGTFELLRGNYTLHVGGRVPSPQVSVVAGGLGPAAPLQAHLIIA
jgi:hypothetical protein